jgi:hypothetical protein
MGRVYALAMGVLSGVSGGFEDVGRRVVWENKLLWEEGGTVKHII